jgi:hypothetical protein
VGSGADDADVSKKVLGMRSRAPLVLLVAQLALDESVIQVEECESIGLDAAREHVADQRVD